MSDTLVLSPSYQPINQISWQEAVSHLYAGVVEVVSAYEDWSVSSPSRTYQVPAVIRFLKGAAGYRKRGIRFSRANVYARDRGLCAYCGTKVPKSEMTWDHVIPRAQGGKSRWENIVTSCLDCNQQKRNRTPAQAGMRLRYKPVKPDHMYDLVLSADIPKQWKQTLRDIGYWHAELDHD